MVRRSAGLGNRHFGAMFRRSVPHGPPVEVCKSAAV